MDQTVEVQIIDLGGNQRDSLVISQYCNISDCKRLLKLDADFILLNGDRVVKETEEIRTCERQTENLILTLFKIKSAIPETIKNVNLTVTIPSWTKYHRGEHFRSESCEIKHLGLFHLLVFPKGTQHSSDGPSIFIEAEEPQKDDVPYQQAIYYSIRLVNWTCLAKSLIRFDEHIFTTKYNDRGWHDYLDAFPNCDLEDGFVGPLETLYFTANIF